MENCIVTVFLLYRMCKALMPGDDETMSDDVIWETLPVSFQLFHWLKD